MAWSVIRILMGISLGEQVNNEAKKQSMPLAIPSKRRGVNAAHFAEVHRYVRRQKNVNSIDLFHGGEGGFGGPAV